MRYILRLLITLMFVFVGSVQGRGEVFPLEEYEQNVDNYISSLANMSVEIVETDVDNKGKTKQTKYSIVSIPNFFRVETTSEDIVNGKVVGQQFLAELLRPDGYYAMYKQREDKSNYVLRERDSKIRSVLQLPNTSGITLLVKPLCRTNYPIASLLRGQIQGWELVCTEFHRPGKDSQQFKFQTEDVVNGLTGKTSYELNSDWLLMRSIVTTKMYKRVDEISYTMIEGRQLPTRHTARLYDLPPEIKGWTYQVDYHNYKAYQGKPEDFSLSHFGLTEMGQSQPMGWRRYLSLFSLLLALLFALYFIIRSRLYRSKDLEGK